MIARRIVLAVVLATASWSCAGGDDTTEPTRAVAPPATSGAPAPSTAPSTVATTSAPDSPTTPTTPPTTTTGPETSETPVTTPVAPTTPPTATTAPQPVVDVKVYLVRDEYLAIAHRFVDGPAVLRRALEALLEGPTDAEAAAGIHTEIPTGTELRDVSLADGTAIVDLTGRFESGGGTLSMTARLAEVVFTATQFDNVEQVVFRLDGEPVAFFGGEGIVLDAPQSRNDVDRAFTGGIIIDEPAPGSTVSDRIVVTGEGDVYEGEFPLEVRRDGERLGDVLLVRTGAWGEWIEFEATVTVHAPPGPIELVAVDETGCTPDVEPNCVAYEHVVPLVLAG